MDRLEEIRGTFKRLKKLHPLWKSGDSSYKDRLEKSLEKDLKKMEDLGVARHFSEALLFFGREFVDSVVLESNNRKVMIAEDAAAIFDGTVGALSSDEEKAAKAAKELGYTSYKIIKENGRLGVKPV